MATFDEVMTALRNADASGNNEDASKLAQIAQRMRSGSAGAQTSAPPAPTSNIVSGIRQEAQATIGGLANAAASAREAVQAHLPDGWGGTGPDTLVNAGRATGRAFNDAAAANNYDDGTLESAYASGGVPGAAAHAAKAFVVNAPHTAASYFPPTAALDFASNTQRNAEDRARNDGRTDGPGVTDYLAGAGSAAVQELAARVGAGALVRPAAKTAEGVVVPGVRAALARIGKATATDATTGAVGSEAQYLGTHADTQAGATPGGVVDSAMEGGAAGLVGGAGVRSGIEAVNRIPTDRTAAKGLKGEAIVAKQGEEQSASDMRVATLATSLRQEAEAGGTLGTSPQESNAYKTAKLRLADHIEGAVERLHAAGDITEAQRDALIGTKTGALREAGTHNHLFTPERVNGVVDSLDIEDDVKQGLKDGFRDLNTAAYNSMFKNGTGPLEKAANYVAYPAGAAVAGALGFQGYGMGSAAAAWPVAKGVQMVGRFGDRLLGNRTVPADASLAPLRAAALKRQSLDAAAKRDTLGTLAGAADDATKRSMSLAEFKQAADAETAFQAQRQQAQAVKDAAAKVTAKQQAAIDRQRLMGAVSPDAPISGGHLAEVANWFRKEGYDASVEHVQEAVDRLNARGGFSSPEQYRLAREGHEFPGKTLVPLFKETGAVLADHGIGRNTDVKAGEKADAAIVRAKTKAIVEAAQPKAPRSPVEAPSVANTNQRPPQAPPVPRGPRKAPGGAPTSTPSTTGFEEGRRLHAYAATTFRAKMAEEQSIRSAGNRLDLQETASHIADLKHKDAKAQAYEEALKKFHGDAEALRFVMGPLRTLAGIGGKSEQTANQKAVIKVRSRKTSK